MTPAPMGAPPMSSSIARLSMRQSKTSKPETLRDVRLSVSVPVFNLTVEGAALRPTSRVEQAG